MALVRKPAAKAAQPKPAPPPAPPPPPEIPAPPLEPAPVAYTLLDEPAAARALDAAPRGWVEPGRGAGTLARASEADKRAPEVRRALAALAGEAAKVRGTRKAKALVDLVRALGEAGVAPLSFHGGMGGRRGEGVGLGSGSGGPGGAAPGRTVARAVPGRLRDELPHRGDGAGSGDPARG
jgi:hypothetical protein